MYGQKKASWVPAHGGRRNVLPWITLPGIPAEGRAACLLRAWLELHGVGLVRHANELESAAGDLICLYPNCPSDASRKLDAITLQRDRIHGLLSMVIGLEVKP